jgi:CBS domain containing-hemolysin-like protein
MLHLPLAHSEMLPFVPNYSAMELLLRWLAIFLLILINAFFVTAEFAVVSVRRSRISQLVDAGDVQARTVQELQEGIDRLLSTTQLGITLSSLALGWIGENAMAGVVRGWIIKLPLSSDVKSMAVHSLAIPIAFFLIAYLQIVLGELAPKSVALLYAEEIARFVAPFSVAIARLFNPLIWVLNQSTWFLLRLVGIRYAGQGWYNQVTSPEELQLIITSSSSESTGLEEEERELLTNVLEFGEVNAEDVMIRRPNIITIDIHATVRELLEEVWQSRHSRYVVVDGSLDEVAGFIHLKDIAEPMVTGTLTLDAPIQPWIHPPQFVPEFTPLDELLPVMQQSGQHMAIVVDEFGSAAGLVTIQDLISQIIGESPEVGQDEDDAIQWLDSHTFLVQAQMNLAELNERLHLGLPLSGEYQTLGGFLLYQWQRIPIEGETRQYGDCELTVMETVGPRLDQIRIHRIETASSKAETSSQNPEPSAAEVMNKG